MPLSIQILVQDYEENTDPNAVAGKIPVRNRMAQLWIPTGKDLESVRLGFDNGTFVFPSFIQVLFEPGKTGVNEPEVLLQRVSAET